MTPLPSLVVTCTCAAMSDATRSMAVREPTVTSTVCPVAVADELRPVMLCEPGRDVALPRRRADVDAVDQHAQRVGPGGVDHQVALRGERREGRVDHRLAVGRDLGVAIERREAGLRDVHGVRARRDAHERGDGRGAEHLRVDVDLRARLVDADRQDAGLGRQLLQALADEALLDRAELGAEGLLDVVVGVVRLAEPAQVVERVGHAHLGRGRWGPPAARPGSWRGPPRSPWRGWPCRRRRWTAWRRRPAGRRAGRWPWRSRRSARPPGKARSSASAGSRGYGKRIEGW